MDDVAQLKFILSGNFKDFVAVQKAQFYVFFNFFKIKKRGKAAMLAAQLNKEKKHEHRVAAKNNEIYNHSVVADYFLRGKKKFSDLIW